MAKKRRRKTHSNFTAKVAAYYAVKKATPEEIVHLNMNDPRLTRIDGGRVRPVFYDDGYRMTFEPTR